MSALVPVILNNPLKTVLKISGANKSVIGGTLAEGRTSSVTYIDTDGFLKTALANVPVWENGGLRHESAGTNLILQSEDLGTSWLTLGSPGLTVNAHAGPSGDITADKLANGSSGQKAKYQSATLVSGTTYSMSFFLESAEQHWAQIAAGAGGFGTNAWANFDLTNVAVGNKGGVQSEWISNIRNDLNRCAIIAPSTLTGSGTAISIALINNGDSATRIPSYNNTSTDGIYVWGAQLETGSLPTSYIPTTTTSATRTTCALSIPLTLNLNFFQKSVITMRVRVKKDSSATAKSWLTPSASPEGLTDNGSGAFEFQDSVGNIATADLTSWSAGDIIRIAIGYDDDAGLMSLSASNDDGTTWVTSADTTFVNLTVGGNWLLFNSSTDNYELLDLKVSTSNRSLF